MTCKVKDLVKECTIFELERALEAKKNEQFNMVEFEFRKFGLYEDTLHVKAPLISANINSMSANEIREIMEPHNLRSIRFFYDDWVLT